MEPEYTEGQAYLFHGRMVYIGIVVRVSLRVIVVRNSGWLGTMGTQRMGDLLANGPDYDKVEIEWMPGDMEINIPIASFVAFPWRHATGSGSDR